MTFLLPTADETFKVLIVGAFGTGKTTLIQHISDSPTIGTEVKTFGTEAQVKSTTTVGVEYGVFTVGDEESPVTLLLFGTPGQDRFSEMREVAALGIDGLIVIVNGDDPSTWSAGKELHDGYDHTGRLPTLLIVNRWRQDQELPAGLLEHLAFDPAWSAVASGNVTDRIRAREFLIELLTLILSTETSDEEEPV